MRNLLHCSWPTDGRRVDESLKIKIKSRSINASKHPHPCEVIDMLALDWGLQIKHTGGMYTVSSSFLVDSRMCGTYTALTPCTRQHSMGRTWLVIPAWNS